MSLTGYINFTDAISQSIELLLARGESVDAGHWQGVPTANKPDLQTLEILNIGWIAHMPHSLHELREQIKPNLPWADDHFDERVSRVPSNPGEQYLNWPWWRGQKRQTSAGLDDTYDDETEHFKFTHTYQERFWPKWAGMDMSPQYSNRYQQRGAPGYKDGIIEGIRYRYGDLDDVVRLLLRSPNTRQAYLPIFFPEDTGAVHGGRIPCTLGYHFLLRDHRLHTWYEIRSCDAVRHFRDDLYLAARLALWVIGELQAWEERLENDQLTWLHVVPGDFTFLAHSFHVHKGDLHRLR